MRAKKSFLIAAVLSVWTLLSYVIYMRKAELPLSGNSSHHTNAVDQGDLLQRLKVLEEKIRQEELRHDELVRSLMEMAKAVPSPVAAVVVQSSSASSAPLPAEAPKIVFENVQGVGPPHRVAHVERVGQKPGGGDRRDNEVPHDESKIREIPLDEEQRQLQPASTVYLTPEQKLKALLKENVDHHDFDGPVIPVLVFACNRVSVRLCIDNLLKYRPNARQFPIIVSQDCNDEATRNVIQSYDDVTLIQQPDQNDIQVLPKEKKFKGYYKISRHYGWALNTTFQAGFDYVIIVEDDLNVAPDFFEYFLATHVLLKNDESLWCVSAWNDNGKANIIDETRSDLLYRSDFFPGLGWMLTRKLWAELAPKWPRAFWDDWMRHPKQRKERACIRPEISRTRTFGKIGVSNGLFFEKHLKYIKLNENPIDFTKINMSYLLKENYDAQFMKYVYSCPVVTYEELRRGILTTKDPVRIQYNTREQFTRTAKLLGLMDDLKSGVPRTGYRGVVSFFYNNQRVYLAPNSNWKGYDVSR